MPLLCRDDGGQRGGAVSEYGPRHLPLLPLSFLEREALKVRDPELFIPSVVRSISRISHAVSRLEESGCVRREPCPSDRRVLFAVLTDHGCDVLEEAAPIHVESVRTHLFDQLTPEQQEQLHDISNALLKHLSSLGGVTEESMAAVLQ